MTNTITPQELAKKQARGDAIAIIDVRTPGEFRDVHAPDAINLPLHKVTSEAVRQLANDGPVYLICKSGFRSAKACKNLADDPRLHLTNVEGGTMGWINAGLDVVRAEKTTMSPIGRILLITAMVVLIGMLLKYFGQAG